MSTAAPERTINEDKMNAFLGKVVGDFGAALSSSLVYIGQKLGLYKALAAGEAVTPAELAEKTSTNERYVREWLINQAASGYVDYDAASGRYSLAPEQALALTDESSPFYVGGGFYVIKAMTNATSRIEDYFKNGGGMLWGEHDPDLFVGTGAIFPSRLCSPPDRDVDSRAHRHRREAEGRRQGCRHRLRPRLFNNHHGPGLSQFALLGFRQS